MKIEQSFMIDWNHFILNDDENFYLFEICAQIWIKTAWISLISLTTQGLYSSQLQNGYGKTSWKINEHFPATPPLCFIEYFFSSFPMTNVFGNK